MAGSLTPPPAWDSQALNDPHARDDKAVRVEAMFDAIAPTYERVNTVATLGLDARWRRAAVEAAAVRPGDVVLDVACGTGDMIRAFARGPSVPARIIGLDFSSGMLAGGRYPDLLVPLQLVRGDAQRLPLAGASVNVVSCAFGVRNFQNLQAGLNEMARVLRPGGRVVILEFSLPDNRMLRWGYELYCNAVLPRLGSLLSRDETNAYRYLPKSIKTFETRQSMMDRLRSAGLSTVAVRRMNFGGVALYRAEKST